MEPKRRQKLKEGTLALSDYMTFSTDGDMSVSITRNADVAGKVVLTAHASSECNAYPSNSLMSAANNSGISKSFSITTDDAMELNRFLQMAGISQDTQSKAMDFVTKSGSIPEPMVAAEPVETGYVSIAVMENEVIGEGQPDEDGDPMDDGFWDDERGEIVYGQAALDAEKRAEYRMANQEPEDPDAWKLHEGGMLDTVVEELIDTLPPTASEENRGPDGNIDAAVAAYQAANDGSNEIDNSLLHDIAVEYSINPTILQAALNRVYVQEEELNELSTEKLGQYNKDAEEEAVKTYFETGEWPSWYGGFKRRMAQSRIDQGSFDYLKNPQPPVKVKENVEDLHLTPEEMEQAKAFVDGSYDISEALYDKLMAYYGTVPSEDPLEWLKAQLTQDLEVDEQEYPLQPETPAFGARTQVKGANTNMGDNPLEEEELEEDTDNDYGHHQGPRKVGQITGFDMKGRRDIQSPGANTKQSDNPMSKDAVMESASERMKKLMEAVGWHK